MTLAEGRIAKDKALTREGYFLLLRSIKDWPEFNLFTGGYIMSRMPADSPQFTEGLQWQWQNLCDCASASIDRGDPDYSPYMPLETTEGKKRVCWNSSDRAAQLRRLLPQHGRHAGQSGRLANRAEDLCKRETLSRLRQLEVPHRARRRREQAESNVAVFNDPDNTSKVRMMINSKFACMACHQK